MSVRTGEKYLSEAGAGRGDGRGNPLSSPLVLGPQPNGGSGSVAGAEEPGPEALRANPEKIPQVHIRGDVNAPWRCVAGTIYNVQAAGYPTVGFISNPVDPNG